MTDKQPFELKGVGAELVGLCVCSILIVSFLQQASGERLKKKKKKTDFSQRSLKVTFPLANSHKPLTAVLRSDWSTVMHLSAVLQPDWTTEGKEAGQHPRPHSVN